MSWVLIIGAGWVLAAIVVALLIGQAIHLAGAQESPPDEDPVPSMTPSGHRARRLRRPHRASTPHGVANPRETTPGR
jgi:hypothetical protein